MNMRDSLVNMLGNLLKEMDTVMSQGAGYYTTVPFARRYNKLLGQAASLFPEDGALIQTFDAMEESDPNDPGEKQKKLQEIHIEISQLITLLESTREAS